MFSQFMTLQRVWMAVLIAKMFGIFATLTLRRVQLVQKHVAIARVIFKIRFNILLLEKNRLLKFDIIEISFIEQMTTLVKAKHVAIPVLLNLIWLAYAMLLLIAPLTITIQDAKVIINLSTAILKICYVSLKNE